jgi:hypothetical protein
MPYSHFKYVYRSTHVLQVITEALQLVGMSDVIQEAVHIEGLPKRMDALRMV